MIRELTYPEYAAILAHRVLARHASFESCEECEFIPCRHCGTYGHAARTTPAYAPSRMLIARTTDEREHARSGVPAGPLCRAHC